MRLSIPFLACLLAMALNAGCMYTINGNPDVSLVTVRVSPISVTLPLLDSGDNAAPFQFMAIVTGAGSNQNVSWTSAGVGTDSIHGEGLSATYYLGKIENFGSIFDTVRATSTVDFSRVGKILITYSFPNDVPFIAVPMEVSLLENSAMQFVIDTIHGHTVNNVAWSVISGPGTITSSGLYVAPSTVGPNAVATILAQSGSDTSTSIVRILRATDSLKCFSRDVKPILDNNCNVTGCHDDKEEHMLDFEDARHHSSPGNARESELYKIITELDANERMPPPPASALTPQQVLTIGQWIDDGALECQ